MAIVIRVALGIVFFLLGMVGVVVPVLPGWIFFALAAVLFVPEHRASLWVLAKVESRSPGFAEFIRRISGGRRKL